MVNFKIVERDKDPLMGLKDDFVRLYNSHSPYYKKDEITSKLNISNNQYYRLLRICCDEKLIIPRNTRNKKFNSNLDELEPKFIELYNDKNRYYTIEKICQELCITHRNYGVLRDRCNEKGLLKRRNRKHSSYIVKKVVKDFVKLYSNKDPYYRLVIFVKN